MSILRLLLFRWAPFIYLATALPTVILLAVLTPPFQVPDENSHFLRAVQISEGGLVGEMRSPAGAGGVVPSNAATFGEAFDAMIGHPEARVDRAVAAQMRDLAWDPEARDYAVFSNTETDPPFFYAPAAAALWLARTFGFGLSDSYLGARLATGLAAVGLSALAIGTALRGRALLFALLSLPMALYLFGSVSQDALLIACAALAVGICSRAAGENRPLERWQRLVVAALIGAVVAARPPCFPLLAILLTSLVRPRVPRSFAAGVLIGLVPLCLASAIAVGWIVFGAVPVEAAFGPRDGVSVAGQIDFLRQHWALVPGIVGRTLGGSGILHLRQFIGVFGWSDTLLPPFSYAAWLVVLAAAIGLAWLEEGSSLGFAEGLFTTLCWVLAWTAIYAIMDLTSTRVGGDAVEGVQGRYFLPSTMLLALGVPALAAWRRGAFSVFGNLFSGLGWTTLFLVAAASDWLMIPVVLLRRFYL